MREYRIIAGKPGYRISSDGNVQTCHVMGGAKSGQLTDQWRDKAQCVRKQDGYYFVCLHGKCVYVANLVLEAFHGPCPDGMEICHKDGNKANNSIENLRWGTHQSNMQDLLAHGKQPRGSKVGTSKLDEDIVAEIKRLVIGGMSQSSASRIYGVNNTVVSKIMRGKIWTHVAVQLGTIVPNDDNYSTDEWQ